MDPLLIDVPARIETERLVLRCPQSGDEEALNQAVCETLDELRAWMPWAQSAPSLEDSEVLCRRQHVRFLLGEDLAMFIFSRTPDGSEGVFLGGTGLHRMDWAVRRFEIGYWRRSGQGHLGFATEAVVAISRMAFDRLGAQRVEIRADPANARSCSVAVRAGFTLEGTLRRDATDSQGRPRDTRVYARVRGFEEPECTPV